MGFFNFFKKKNEPSEEEFFVEITKEYKYRISISFFISETTPIELVNKKAALFDDILSSHCISAETSIGEIGDRDEDLVDVNIEFIGDRQFRFEDEVEENQEVENSFPLVSNNMGVEFWMKGGVFAEIAEVIFAEVSQSEYGVDIIFFNYELNKSYDVTLEKDPLGCRMTQYF